MGPLVTSPKFLERSMGIRILGLKLLNCGAPATAIAWSRAMWPLIVTDIVRRTNLSSFITNRLLDAVGADPSDVCSVPADPDEADAAAVVAEAMELFDMLDTAEEAVLDFLRDRGHDNSRLGVLGGGGNGQDFISPIRRSVNVSWAFVGAPTNSVLYAQLVREVEKNAYIRVYMHI